MKLLFLGTGASDWNGPDDRGEYRRHASALLDNCLLIDVTKSVLDMIRSIRYFRLLPHTGKLFMSSSTCRLRY